MDTQDLFTQDRAGSGTRQWSEKSLNVHDPEKPGCLYECEYCYARSLALRFHKIDTWQDWNDPRILKGIENRKFGRRKGVTMFPTTHDITLDNMLICAQVLRNLLAPGNAVLIVTKPALAIVAYLAEELAHWKENIVFRLTITTVQEPIREIFEPHAPPIQERMQALEFLFKRGFRTSVVCEPLLGGAEVVGRLFMQTADFITEDFWVGFLNRPTQRMRKEILQRPETRQILGQITPHTADVIEKMSRLSDAAGCRFRLKESIHRLLESE